MPEEHRPPLGEIAPMTAAEHGRAEGRVVDAMAACIRGRRAGLGYCGPESLIADGFTEDEIARWWDVALRDAGQP